MAKPIKETPFLRGKDAKKFVEKMNESRTQKVPKEEYDRVMSNYRKIKATMK
jgi:hypothetical protein